MIITILVYGKELGLVRTFLSMAGFSVHYTNEKEKFVALADDPSFDVFLLVYEKVDAESIALIRSIRRRRKESILLICNDAEKFRQLVLREGASRCLSTSFAAVGLLEGTLRKVLEVETASS